ncbi:MULTISPECIES: protoporphyrinogen oxidase [Bacillaceae]|uniref:Coproporphyrinogen III oxidase n=1 Tax=Evansella alkalicola TaxID=745819 RepID=A0ABS6JQ92_9BACI|nr:MULTISPECIES: protoporphyrinogen oxidase [Bacillaceae]MBU9720710.1 protoporphyrinogen oxidase [Bacillus alkalicola]
MGKKRVAIIGGGITGISAAFYLQREIENGLNAEYVLYESSEKLGGKIQTEYRDGFVIELGPDSFLARKPSAAQLAKEVGIDGDLVRNSAGKSYILRDGTLYPMPGGAIFGIPTQWGPFLKTKLISPVGKIRAAGDLLRGRTSSDGGDQSLGSFFRRRLGNEVVDNLIDPLLSGIYAGDIDRISLQATFPHFQQIEAKYRSLIVGMKSSIAKRQSGSPQGKKGGKSPGMFYSLKNGGLMSLVEAVESHLGDCVKKNTKLISVKMDNSGSYLLEFEDGKTDTVDRVIFATPHHVTYEILKDHKAVSPLNEIPSTSVATVVLAFEKEAIKKDIDGSGFVVASKKDYSITACTWTHKKWEHSTPEGYALLRGYVGRAGDEEIVYKSDEEIVEAVMKDLSKIMEIDGKPSFHIVKRWKKSMPQYEVGHLERLKQMYVDLHKELPNVHITGGAFKGIGIPDCINQGKETAEAVAKSLL